jgi:hypothetical protein
MIVSSAKIDIGTLSGKLKGIECWLKAANINFLSFKVSQREKKWLFALCF